MENETKAWYESTTIQGAIISALGLVITLLKSVLGVELLSTEEIGALVSGVLGLVGLVMVIVGRLKSTQTKIGWSNSK